ncbi:hypothetical protein RUM43_011386 [Polyplax serrata]|uniref:Uncharacterized protein n=1 Tax=Polyplax serrata TaxID=468196 RepID=A0AAN8NY68_POLSC
MFVAARSTQVERKRKVLGDESKRGKRHLWGFSVSTLRRSHSGNHVVVIAKKPHGWNSSRQSVLLPPPKGANSSTYHLSNKTKHTTIPVEPSTMVDSPGIYTSTSRTIHYEKKPPITTTQARKTTKWTEPSFTTKPLAPTTTTTETSNPVAVTNKPIVPTPVPHLKEEHHFVPELVPSIHEISASPTTPTWFEKRKWNFETPSSFISWSRNKMSNNSLSTAVGGICAVSVIIIIIIVLVKSLPDRKRTSQKETAESKEDKKRLLKPSARTSDEE